MAAEGDNEAPLLGGRYRLVRPLGKGGMGEVHEGLQVDLERRVAIKLLHPSLVGDPALAARFRREAKTVAQLHHPHIVQVSDFGVDGRRPFMVMEYLEGESLREHLRRHGPLAPERALAILGPVLRALAAAHAKGIVHRDVKPENVFLVWDEDHAVPKLLDFGIAKGDADTQRLTATHGTLGTALYMAPEQVRASREAGPAADQYATAVMLFEMLTGAFPHEAETPVAMAVAKMTQAPRDLRGLRPALPAHVGDAVMRALELDPTDRFGDVTAFRRALEGRADDPRPSLEQAETLYAQAGTLPPLDSTGGGRSAPEGSSMPAAHAPLGSTGDANGGFEARGSAPESMAGAIRGDGRTRTPDAPVAPAAGAPTFPRAGRAPPATPAPRSTRRGHGSPRAELPGTTPTAPSEGPSGPARAGRSPWVMSGLT
ncbi:MAG TPA: protein kinase, partial [Sandaracinaceae bacterium LLY-WYZ-13_1]|nr:protein kinase [Sandaracinaceae bacterium LLY-WYZ-13_1]